MQIYTVSQITNYIKDLLDFDQQLQDLWLEGEVSNFSQSTTGHVYFTLKDENSQIRCVLWRSLAQQQSHLPQDGQAIVAHGRVSVYEAQGAYQFYIDTIQPLGLGILHLQFEALKARLQEEGLFAVEHKRPLPPYPQRIGLVTSPQAAALRDILHVLERRYPLTEVLLAPTLVQGDEAPPQIVEAIRALNDRGDVDLIIVARGGGSLEELWAFNDERVARAIYDSQVPVIAGVGHEVDFTIADFVADVRAPTPSVAAELAVPEARELHGSLETWRRRLAQAMTRSLAQQWTSLQRCREDLSRFSPRARIYNYRQRIDDLSKTSLSQLRHQLEVQREKLQGLLSALQSLSPLRTLERGYAIVRHRGTGQVVKRVAQVEAGHGLNVRVSDGEFAATVD